MNLLYLLKHPDLFPAVIGMSQEKFNKLLPLFDIRFRQTVEMGQRQRNGSRKKVGTPNFFREITLHLVLLQNISHFPPGSNNLRGRQGNYPSMEGIYGGSALVNTRI